MGRSAAGVCKAGMKESVSAMTAGLRCPLVVVLSSIKGRFRSITWELILLSDARYVSCYSIVPFAQHAITSICQVENYETDMRFEMFHAKLEEASVSVSRLQEASLGG